MRKHLLFTPWAIPRALASLTIGLSTLAGGCVDSQEPSPLSTQHSTQRAEVDNAIDVALLALTRVDELAAAHTSSPDIAAAHAQLRLAVDSLGTAGQDLRLAGTHLVPDRDAPLGTLSIRGGQVTPRLRGLARAVRNAGLEPNAESDVLAAIAGARVAVRSLDLAVRDLYDEVAGTTPAEEVSGMDFTAQALVAPQNGPLFPGSSLYVLDEGHIDAIDIAYENGFELSIHDETVNPDVERDPATTILVAKSAARMQIPDARFAFLGPIGASAWILPEAQTDAEAAGILWPGLATAEVEAGVFVDDSVRVRIRQVFGPNGFSLFFSPPDETTPPTILVDSENGLPDHIILPVGTHTHANWAFESPGLYLIKYDVSGRLTGVPGNPTVRSSTTTLKFVVIP